MTKYSAPSIEVVNFNSSDAPRIGMQWWLERADDPSLYMAAPGFNPDPSLLSGGGEIDATPYNIPCAQVHKYRIEATYPGANSFTNPEGRTFIYGLDDGRSC